MYCLCNGSKLFMEIGVDTPTKIVKLKENDSFGKLTDNQGRHEVDFRIR